MSWLARWWADLGRGCEALARSQRPWEHEGPLRWCKPWFSPAELHGATLPTPPRPAAPDAIG